MINQTGAGRSQDNDDNISKEAGNSQANMDQPEVLEQVNNLKRCIEALREENSMLELFLMLEEQSEASRKTQGRNLRGSSPEEEHHLKRAQKHKLALNVENQMGTKLKTTKEVSQKELQDSKATLKGAELQLTRIKKECVQFDQEVGSAIRNKKNMTINAAKIVKYFDDCLKTKEKYLERLKRKNSALIANEKKLQIQLEHQKKLTGEVTPVNFEIARMENIKYHRDLISQHKKIQDLKRLALRSSQSLSLLKEKLQSATLESDAVLSDISTRMNLLLRIEEKSKQADEERCTAEAINGKFRGQLADFYPPQVVEYVTAKENHLILQKKVHEWERKVEIAEMTLQAHNKTWHRLQAAGVGLEP